MQKSHWLPQTITVPTRVNNDYAPVPIVAENLQRGGLLIINRGPPTNIGSYFSEPACFFYPSPTVSVASFFLYVGEAIMLQTTDPVYAKVQSSAPGNTAATLHVIEMVHTNER